ncbi:MAG: glycosyltransferase family 1 protein [Pseudomonadota bacterium]
MRIALVTDAWRPQINGVVRTYENVTAHIESLGHQLLVVDPGHFQTIPCPTYPTIRLALLPARRVRAMLDDFEPERLHIATEGPIGQAAHRLCRQRQWAFTTSFHTQFPEYIRARLPVPLGWSYACLRRFHGHAERTLVPTQSQRERLESWGFRNLAIWARGVDATQFQPYPESILDVPRPVLLYVGRVAVEKNIDAFLDLAHPGTKVVVGEGPAMNRLQSRYPDTMFVGAKVGEELGRYYASADVFVFPSLTDTFGIVMLEAMACGVPVAAFPVTGPIDVIEQGSTGIMDDDLDVAVERALTLNPDPCIAYAASRTWANVGERFLSLLTPLIPETA